jgi:hypothetical protein
MPVNPFILYIKNIKNRFTLAVVAPLPARLMKPEFDIQLGQRN